MKQDTGVKAFKNEIANYEYYIKNAQKLRLKLDNCYASLPGALRTNDPSRAPMMGGVPDKEREYKVRAEIERLERDLRRLEDKINYINEILAKIEKPLCDAIIDKYARGKTLEQVSATMFISSVGLLMQINKAIKKALDN